MKKILGVMIVFSFLFNFAFAEGMKHGTETKAADPKAAEGKMVFDAPQKEGVNAVCPVTGEAFVIKKDTLHSEYKGKHVYFCCAGCKGPFDKEPEKYLNKKTPKAK